MKQASIIAANELQATTDEVDFRLGFGILAANQYSTAKADNWIQLSPFGKFRNVAGMQVFTPDDGHTIANEFNSTANIGVRAIGLPWYVGHPDHPDFKDQYDDKAAKGRIKAVEVRHDPHCIACKSFVNQQTTDTCDKHGLFGNVKWNDEGKKLIANESFHGHSVNWRMKHEGDGYHPFSLKSVGFTNEPGIPVPAITAANEKGKTMTAKPSLLDYISKLLGKPVATDDEAMANMDEYAANSAKSKSDLADMTNKHAGLSTMCNAMMKRYGCNEAGEVPATLTTSLTTAGFTVPEVDLIPFMANELSTVATQRAQLKTVGDEAITKIATVGVKPAAGENLLTVMANEIVTRTTNFVNERKSRAVDLLAVLKTGGFITDAEQKVYETDLANEEKFVPTMAALVALKPKINVVSQVGPLGKVGAEVQAANQKTADRTDKIIQAVNEWQDEQQKKTGKRPDYIPAFAHVQKTRHDLFSASEEETAKTLVR